MRIQWQRYENNTYIVNVYFYSICIYFYWFTDLEPKVPLPDCASRFLRLAFFLELSTPKDLRTCFTEKRYVPLSLEK